ncbi:putative acetyltransferase [bioreactor metagenome]|uniref:Putative acetyltransferase n=1 Tax=bioreactor metagenome TaxID=1076179 RepID=A0A645INH6_9ZZZZ
MNCTFLDDDRITIGDYTLIAPDVKIYTAFHPMTPEARWEEKHIVDGFEFPVTHTAPVTIGAHVWIGGGTIILPGVSIGDGCVVGTGSLVTRDIPAGSVAYGSPCRVVRENM